MAEKSHPIKKYLFLKHFHSIFKVNHIHSKKSIHLLTCYFYIVKRRVFLIRVYFARELYSTSQGQFKYTFLGIFRYFKATLDKAKYLRKA